MSETILIVEDSKTLRTILGFQLKKAGYVVQEADNGVQGLALASAQPPPDLIISDVMMPEMDGLELCRRVRLLPGMGGIPFILLTTRQEEHHRREGMEAGATDYMLKPYDAHRLLETLRGRLSATSRAAG